MKPFPNQPVFAHLPHIETLAEKGVSFYGLEELGNNNTKKNKKKGVSNPIPKFSGKKMNFNKESTRRAYNRDLRKKL